MGSHLADILPRDGAVQKANVAARGPGVAGSLFVRFSMRVEIGVVTNDRAPGAVRGENPLEAVAVDVEIGDEHQGGIVRGFLRRDPGVGHPVERRPGSLRVAPEVVVASSISINIIGRK